MRGLQIIPYNTNFDFVKIRYVSYFVAVFIVLFSLGLVIFKGFNLGIDFKGGISIEIRSSKLLKIGELRSAINFLKLGDVKLQDFGDDYNFLIRVEQQSGGEKENSKAVKKIKNILEKTFGNNIEYRKVETVGAKVSKYLVENGLWAVAFALIGMLFYIWIRFEWEYGLCGIIAIIHDAIAVLGFYAISGFEFNESAFAALLTTIGYSINDTVVVYDRLRENIIRHKNSTVKELINLSVNETLSRTILTSGTTLLALFALYVFGGPVIENFSMPIIIGIVVGTFSSIFLSMNLLLFFDINKKVNEEPAPYGPVSNNSTKS